jgi:parallel beta-helix repeat protein
MQSTASYRTGTIRHTTITRGGLHALFVGLTLILLAAVPAAALTFLDGDACGTDLNVPGETYVLTADLLDCPDAGLRVSVDNVRLFLKGYTVDGDDVDEDSGILAVSVSGLQVIGPGTIQGFANGIDLIDVSHSSFTRILLQNNAFRGVSAENADNCQFIGLRVQDNGSDGIKLEQGSDENLIIASWIAGNGFDDQNEGIDLEEADKNRIIGCTVVGNFGSGIELSDDSDENLIKHNWIYDNDGSGIVLFADPADEDDALGNNDGNHLVANWTKNNGSHGIQIEADSVDNRVSRNISFGNAANDMLDNNTAPPCQNDWRSNAFGSAAGDGEACIR